MQTDRVDANRWLPRYLALAIAVSAAAGCGELPTGAEPARDSATAAVDEPSALLFPNLRSCRDGTLASGALFRVCVPLFWNGSVVVWAPGYAAPQEPLAIRDSEIQGRTVSEIVNGLGYAFATTSFRTNGLVPQGVEDLVDVVDEFERGVRRSIRHVYAVGASHGGLTVTRAIEQEPDVFDGGIAMCGPIGDFGVQLNWIGDFRVIFDVFFTQTLNASGLPWSPWTAASPMIPPALIAGWDAGQLVVLNALAANPALTAQLLSVTGAPVDPGNLQTSIAQTVLGLLWYHVLGTNDALTKLSGNPFHNTGKLYSGSANDALLNAVVQRFTGDPAAIPAIQAGFTTTGALPRTLVTLHTTSDPIVPYAHAPAYTQKVQAAGAQLRHVHIPALRYGHCNFKLTEVLAAFAILVLKASAQELVANAAMLPDPQLRAEFIELAGQHGARPKLVGERIPVVSR